MFALHFRARLQGPLGSARWRAALRDSARPGEVGLATSPRTPVPTCLVLGTGVHILAGALEATALSLSRSFCPPSGGRGRRNGERAGTRRFLGPSLSPPLPGAQIVLEAWVPRPSARMLGRWEGFNGAPSPCGSCRRMSGSDEGRWTTGPPFYLCSGLCKSAQ